MILLQLNDLHQAPGEPPPEGEETGGGRREDYRRKESPPKPNMRASLLLFTFLLALAGLTAVQSARRQPARMETSLNDIVSHHARRLFRRLHQTLKKEIDQFQVSGEGLMMLWGGGVAIRTRSGAVVCRGAAGGFSCGESLVS